jgi:hypothetical protein
MLAPQVFRQIAEAPGAEGAEAIAAVVRSIFATSSSGGAPTMSVTFLLAIRG